MIRDLADRASVSQTVIVLLIALVLVQVGLALFALADLVRRERVAGGRKWLWAALILFGNIAGSVLYLVVGRNAPPQILEDPSPPAEAGETHSERIHRGIDALYGPEQAQT